MINFFSSWVKNLSFAIIIVSILEMIIPNNKTKKYVKMVMGLYVLFSIISPFIENYDKFNLNDVKLDFYKEDIEETLSISTEVNQSSMDKRLDKIYEEELQKDIIYKIKEKGYELESCKVTAHISDSDSGIEKIVLKIKSKVENEVNKEESSLEGKIVTEIQKIQKVEINKNSTTEEVTTEFTKTDIKIIKDFLIKEYGVNEKCLRIS